MVDRRRVAIDRVLETEARALDNPQVALRPEKANATLAAQPLDRRPGGGIVRPVVEHDPLERRGVGILAQDAVGERLEVIGRRIPHRRQQADQARFRARGVLRAASRERLETMHLVLVSGPVPEAGRDDRRAFVIAASLAFPHGTSLEHRQLVEQPGHDLGHAAAPARRQVDRGSGPASLHIVEACHGGFEPFRDAFECRAEYR